MSKIAIFVSHRIDLNSKIIHNPLYKHMRCGAVYDETENPRLLGDNTGDNISERRMSFCEYTVQYWAWKNYDADYYGLCHYRRYLSFSDYYPTENPHRFAVEENITLRNIFKYSLGNPIKMKRFIEKYDVVTSVTYNVSGVAVIPKASTEFELWIRHPRLVVTPEMIDLVMRLIKEKYPEYYEAALDLMQSNQHRGFNCFVMRRDLFFKMCQFEFDIMFELEKQIDVNQFGGNSGRIIGYLGEILYGTFIHWLEMQKKYKIKEQQIVYFRNTQTAKDRPKSSFYERLKNLAYHLFPSYRVSLRIEEKEANELSRLRREMRSLKNSIDQLTTKQEMLFWFQNPIYPSNIDEIKQNFWRSYPGAQGDLKIIQEGNYILLMRMKTICDSLGVKFWLHGGSLVGGVRHNGFIPWDDDIDVAMMRRDFNKVKDYLENHSSYFIREFYYTSLCCRSYRFMRKDMETNCFVDIFLYDDYSCSENSVLEDWKKLVGFKEGIRTQLLNIVKDYNFIPNDSPLENNLKLKNDFDKLLDTYINKVKSNQSAEYICWGLDNNYENSTRYAWHHGRIFSKEDIFPLQECRFNTITCYIPNNFVRYVFAEYGINYLDMPKDMGISKHINNYFSSEEDIKNITLMIEKEQKG